MGLTDLCMYIQKYKKMHKAVKFVCVFHIRCRLHLYFYILVYMYVFISLNRFLKYLD